MCIFAESRPFDNVQTCVIQSSNDGIIVCVLPFGGTAGSNAIQVNVEGRGFATGNAVAFVDPLGVIGVTPANVSIAGGAHVTVAGMQRF